MATPISRPNEVAGEASVAVAVRVNGRDNLVGAALGTSLPRVLKDALALTGTELGCGVAPCCACTVSMDGDTARSRSIAIKDAKGTKITPIESDSGTAAEAVRSAWDERDVMSCRCCQSDQVVSAIARISTAPKLDDSAILHNGLTLDGGRVVESHSHDDVPLRASGCGLCHSSATSSPAAEAPLRPMPCWERIHQDEPTAPASANTCPGSSNGRSRRLAACRSRAETLLSSGVLPRSALPDLQPVSQRARSSNE